MADELEDVGVGSLPCHDLDRGVLGDRAREVAEGTVEPGPRAPAFASPGEIPAATSWPGDRAPIGAPGPVRERERDGFGLAGGTGKTRMDGKSRKMRRAERRVNRSISGAEAVASRHVPGRSAHVVSREGFRRQDRVRPDPSRARQRSAHGVGAFRLPCRS